MNSITISAEDRKTVADYLGWVEGFEESSLFEDYQTYDTTKEEAAKLPKDEDGNPVHFTNDQWDHAMSVLIRIAGIAEEAET